MSTDVLKVIGAASTATERDLFAYDEADEVVSPEWRITDLNGADWALKRMAECAEEAASIDAQFEAAVAQLVARRDALKLKAERGAGFFRLKLMEYAERERRSLLTGKRKSKELLHGKIQWRAKAERLEVMDKKALETWLRAQPIESGLARWKVEPEMKAIQEHFRTSGVIPDGCEVRAAEEVVSIDAIAPERALTKGE